MTWHINIKLGTLYTSIQNREGVKCTADELYHARLKNRDSVYMTCNQKKRSSVCGIVCL